MRWGQAVAVAAVISWGTTAWAGGSGSGTGSGTDSGTGTGTDSGTGTGTGTDSGTGTDAGTGSSTGCDTDGMCTDPGDSITLDSPTDGQTVTSPVAVTVSSTFACTCDANDECCFEEDPTSVVLLVDGQPTDCEIGTCMLSLDLDPGEYVLRAQAQYSFGGESTPEITITVDGPVGTSTTGSADDTSAVPATTTGVGTGTGTGTDTDASASGGDSGCSCAQRGPSGWHHGLPWLAVVVVGMRRAGPSRNARGQ